MSLISDIEFKFSKALEETRRDFNNALKRQEKYTGLIYGVNIENQNIFSLRDSIVKRAGEDGKLKYPPQDYIFNFKYRELKDSIEEAKRFFGIDGAINFLAIDGSCKKIPMHQYALFFGGAFGLKGRITENRSLEYISNFLDESLTLTTYAPVPYSQWAEVINLELEETQQGEPTLTEELQTYQELHRSTNIHYGFMKLAELSLAYKHIKESPKNGKNKIHMVLLDNSLLNMLKTMEKWFYVINVKIEKRKEDENFEKFNNEILNEEITVGEMYLIYSLFQLEPKLRVFNTHYWMLKEIREKGFVDLNNPPQGFSSQDLEAFIFGDSANDQYNIIRRMEEIVSDKDGKGHFFIHDKVNNKIYLNEHYSFSKIKEKMKKIVDSLVSHVFSTQGNARIPLSLLTNFKLRILADIVYVLLVEMCREKRILLVGVAKDSSVGYLKKYLPLSTYFDRNYSLEDSIKVKELLYKCPRTDRQLLEMVSFLDSQEKNPSHQRLSAPWATIEFDPCCRTINFLNSKKINTLSSKDEAYPYLEAKYVSYEKTYLRHYCCLYSSRSGFNAHPLLVDRLFYKEFDETHSRPFEFYIKKKNTNPYFKISSVIFREVNPIQALVLDTLYCMTTNNSPGGIGYPEPLYIVHKLINEFEKKVTNIMYTHRKLSLKDHLEFRQRDMRR